VLALVGGALGTLVAGAAGGAFANLPELAFGSPGFRTELLVSAAAGAPVVPMAAAGSPFLGLLWLALIAATHAAAGAARHG
jgi:hypothetical protein